MTIPNLIVAAHGNRDESYANASLRRLAKELSDRLGCSVEVAYNQGSPSFAEAATSASTGSIVIPVMTSDGYFLRERLVPACVSAGRGLRVAPPIGVQPQLRRAVAQRAASCAAAAPSPSGTILVVGHGTKRHAGSSTTTRQLVGEIRQLLTHDRLEWRVLDAYLDQPPLLERVAETLSGALVVVPWLIGGGGHDLDDLSDRVGLESAAPRDRWIASHDRHVRVLPSLLDAEFVLPAVQRAYRDAEERLPLRLATRASRLALWQAEQVRHALASVGVPTILVPIEPEADRDLTLPATIAGMFTDDITRAIAEGRADAAVHSLKDLPLSTEASPYGIAAVLTRDTADEVLVASGGRSVADLRHGAVVGTSSVRRSRQIQALRPDVRVGSIRGTVEHRVAQVLDGTFDATILAAAGLERLGMDEHISERFGHSLFAPEPGQGVIAIQTRTADEFVSSLVSRVNCVDTRLCVVAEREYARQSDAAGRYVCAVAVRDAATGTIALTTRVITAHRALPAITKYGTDPIRLARDAAESVTQSALEEIST